MSNSFLTRHEIVASVAHMYLSTVNNKKNFNTFAKTENQFAAHARINFFGYKVGKFSLFIMLAALQFFVPVYGNCWLGLGTDLEFNFFGKYKPEVFFGNRLNFFNANNPFDKNFFMRQTADFTNQVFYGKKTYERPIVEGCFTMRSKNLWGNPNIFKTTGAEIKILDAVLGEHSHSIPRILWWMRESWIRFPLGRPVGLDFKNRIDLTIGIFAFDLGRGIALGDSFAAGQDSLGFYSDSLVDQYAPGVRLSADILPNVLSYDLYGALLQNNSGSIADTGAKILGQEYGKRNCPQRGFGKINYLIAGRLQWKVFDLAKLGSLMIEPYAFFNSDPEQKVQFLADASTKLGTAGLAAEYAGNLWEFGFDSAINFGYQRVKGWDRNTIETENRNGRLTFVNSHVLLNADPQNPAQAGTAGDYKAPHSPKVVTSTFALSKVGKQAQAIINSTPQGKQYNGQQIGTVAGFTADVDAPSPTPIPTDDLYNAIDRFRDPYKNKLQGWMIVGDAAWWVYKRDLKVAVTGGVASGDANPNEELVDGNYKGFIGLQEAYSGKRVPSAFLLGGAGKARRPLSVPTSDDAQNDFSSVVSGFTDLVIAGAGVTWTPTDWKKQFSMNSNVLAYWEQFPTKKFNIKTRTNCEANASSFLGTELNLFIKYDLLKNLRWFTTISIFIPGSHYTDIRGKPLTSDQNKQLDALDRTGYSDDAIPNINDHTAVTFNTGLEFKF